MRINHNIAELNTYNKLSANTNATQGSLEKLSSGLRINKAGDDAAGLAISEKMRGQIRGLEQASKNAQDGISLIQTAEGALTETQSILQRMRELSVQSSNDTNDDTNDRKAIQKEVDELSTELSRINKDTTFNGKSVFGQAGTDASFKLHIGADTNSEELDVKVGTFDAKSLNVTKEIKATDSVAANYKGTTFTAKQGTDTFSITTDKDGKVTGATKGGTTVGIETLTGDFTVDNASADKITFSAGTVATTTPVAPAVGSTITAAVATEDASSGIDVSSQTSAKAAIDVIDNAINTVSSQRAQLGAWQNRLDHTINNLSTSSENMTAAESRIRDVDMASEMMEFTKNNILSQATQSMLAQANQRPQGVLQLLQ
nr:flagellin [Terribacillus saccharophilus]